MERENVVENFFEKYAKDKKLDLLQKLDIYCKKNMDILADKFSEQFQRHFQKIVQKQQREEKKEIGNIYLQVLRTGILHKEYTILLSAYDAEGYFDKEPVQTHFTAGEFFTFLELYQQYLLEQSKQFIGKVNADDIEIMVQKEALIYIKYIVKIARIALQRAIHTEAFQNIKKAGQFAVYAGEYKDYIEQIYFISDKRMKKKKIRKNINHVENGKFYFQPFTEMDLSKLVLKKSNFCFTDFSGSDLTEADMRASYFVNAIFSNCTMEFCHFSWAVVFDANFENANLKGAEFCYAAGGITVPNEKTEYVLGFSGVNFSNANLEYADFSSADFSGADFRGAKLKGADFSGACLKNAFFDKKDIENLQLTQEQTASIIIC